MNARNLLFIILLFIGCSVNAQGISPVGDLPGAGPNYKLMESVEFNGSLYFSTWSDFNTILWKLNGTSAPEKIYTWPSIGTDYALNKLYSLNGKLFFTGLDSLHGKELWTSDGTAAGTHMVKDIFVGRNSAFEPMGNRLSFSILPYVPFKSLNGKVLFVANDTAWNNNSKIWETDGTEAGTKKLVKFSSDSFSCGVDIGILNQKAWFFASKDGNDFGYYNTDGTSSATAEVKHRFWAQDLVNYGSRFFFNGSFFGTPVLGNYISGFGTSDGTANGTLFLDSTISYSADHVYYFGRLYFFGATKPGAFYSSDGTKAGTLKIKDTILSLNYSNTFLRNNFNRKTRSPLAFNNRIYFCTPSDIWSSDGTNAGTKAIKAFVVDSSKCTLPIPFGLITANDGLYFKAWDNTRIELFTSDGTGAGTRKISMAGANYVDSNYIRCNQFSGTELTDPIMVFNNQIYFTAIYDKAVGKALYKLNLPTGLHTPQALANVLTVFPNPASAKIGMQYPKNGYSTAIVYDALGRNLGAHSISDSGEDFLDVANLSPGNYFIKLVGSKAPLCTRVVIER